MCSAPSSVFGAARLAARSACSLQNTTCTRTSFWVKSGFLAKKQLRGGGGGFKSVALFLFPCWCYCRAKYVFDLDFNMLRLHWKSYSKMQPAGSFSVTFSPVICKGHERILSLLARKSNKSNLSLRSSRLRGCWDCRAACKQVRTQLCPFTTQVIVNRN